MNCYTFNKFLYIHLYLSPSFLPEGPIPWLIIKLYKYSLMSELLNKEHRWERNRDLQTKSFKAWKKSWQTKGTHMRKMKDYPAHFSQTPFFFLLNKSNLVFPPFSCPTFNGISTEKSGLRDVVFYTGTCKAKSRPCLDSGWSKISPISWKSLKKVSILFTNEIIGILHIYSIEIFSTI